MATTGERGSTVDRPPVIVGREAEVGVIGAFLASAAPGPAALVIQGEAGIGKTTIVRTAISRAAAAGIRVFAARPSSAEMELPYAGLGDLFDRIEPEMIDGLVAPQREALAAALGRQGSTRTVERHALSRGVLEVLRQVTADQRVLLVIDDVQWLDGPTAFALGFALRRLGPQRLQVLVAARIGDGAPGDLPLGLADWEPVRRLIVGPMSATELGAVVREQLGVQLPRPQLDRLRAASNGNPMFAVELVRLGDDEGLGTAPRTLPDALAERLRGIGDEPRAVLTFAAAARHPTTALLLRAGISRSQLRSALSTGLLVADGDGLAFAHPLLGAAAYRLLLPDERRSVHARLADASLDAVERGHHLSRSLVGPDDVGSNTLRAAAEAASSMGDHATAAAFLLRSAELIDSDGARRRAIEVDAAEQLLLAGDVSAANVLTSRLVETLPAGVLRARARVLRANGLVGAGLTFDANMAELTLALADAEADDAAAAELHLELAEAAAGMLLLGRSVEHLRAAMRRAELAGIGTLGLDAMGSLGLIECLLGNGVTDTSTAAFAAWDGSIRSINTYSPRLSLAEALLYAGRFTEAQQLYVDELAAAAAQGMEVVEVMARVHLAETQVRAGNWTAALANARIGLEHARQAADDQVVTGVAYALGMTEALLGDLGSARARASVALAAAESSGDFWHTMFNRSVLGLVALSEGNPAGAVDVLAPAWSAIVASELGDLSVFPVAHVLGEALAAVGRVDESRAVADELRRSPGGGRPWSRAMAARLDALTASAEGDHEAARQAVASALAAHAELPEPFEHARTVHIQGRVEGRARNWGAARVALVDALERFDQLGAARWAERAASEIARLPGRRPGDRHALTEREREVAELAASGLSNKEITARLFLSARTVESHLSSAYDKLGVRSRVELAGRLGRSAGE